MSWGDINDRSGRRRSRGWGAVLVVLAVAAIVGLGVFLFVRSGDPARSSRSIENRTEQTVYLYLRDAEGSEDPFDLAPRIRPHSSVVVYGCGGGEWVARTLDGTLVARRGPFEECNSEDWIIEEEER
jgi:hypothetical protein